VKKVSVHPLPGTERAVQLGDDMINIAETPQNLNAPFIYEDSGINKIGNTYYYSYCTNFEVHTYEMFNQHGDGGNNHHAMFEFKGKYYMLYHSRLLEMAMGVPGSIPGQGYRSTHIDEVTIQPDGTIAGRVGRHGNRLCHS